MVCAISKVSDQPVHMSIQLLTEHHFEFLSLTLNVPIATSRLLFSSAEMFTKPLWQTVWANSVDPDQTAPIGAVCSGSRLFASIINSSVM